MFERSSHLINKKFKEYLIPTTLSGMSMMLGAIVDGIIVGKTIGADAMAAVNVAEPIVLLFQTLFFLFGMGGATLVAISKGERNNRKANAVYTLGSLTLLVLSLVILAMGLVFLDELVGVICNNASLFNLAKEYVRILLIGSPFMLFVPGMVFFIRADGQPKLSANILLIANGVNLIMDLLYIQVFNMGIDGAALATVTGYAVGFILIVKYWLSKKRTLSYIRLTREDLPLLGETVSSGLAGAVNTLLLTVKTLCVNRIVLAVGGADGMAVFAVCNFAISFVSMFNSGAADTMVPLLGMLYGERDWQGIRFVLKRAFTVVITCCLISIVLMEILPVQILAMFSVTAEAQVAMGVPALRIFAFSLLGVGISYTMMYYLQTTKHRNISVAISVLRGFALIIPCAWLFSSLFGMMGIWWAYVVAEALTIVITLLLCLGAARHFRGQYTGVFLYERQSGEESLFDVTIHSETQDAVAVSDSLIAFGRENGLNEVQANQLGLMAEEAAVNIIEYNDGERHMEMDILCRIRLRDILLSLRDDGSPFDTMALKPQEEGSFRCDGITVINSIAKSVEYARTLGLNSTVVVLEREE